MEKFVYLTRKIYSPDVIMFIISLSFMVVKIRPKGQTTY